MERYIYNTAYYNTIPIFYRALWIIGMSGIGKSTLATRLAKEGNYEIVECGKEIRSMHHKNAGVAELTATTLSLLEKDHRYFSKVIKNDLNRIHEAKDNKSIVVGCRNPTDFVDNFHPKNDAIIFLGLNENEPFSSFEANGIEAIVIYVSFLKSQGIIKESQILRLYENLLR
jgi:hypothetical protein